MPQDPDIQTRRDKASYARWLETQRGRPQIRPAPTIGRAVTRVMRPLSKKHGSGVAALEPHWDTIIGSRFAKISSPVKFAGSAKGRQLVIKAPGPAGALIMANQNRIIEKLNGFLGPGHVKSIKVIQSRIRSSASAAKTPKRGLAPSVKRELQSGLDHVSDPDLKSALNKLGQSVYAKAQTEKKDKT